MALSGSLRCTMVYDKPYIVSCLSRQHCEFIVFAFFVQNVLPSLLALVPTKCNKNSHICSKHRRNNIMSIFSLFSGLFSSQGSNHDTTRNLTLELLEPELQLEILLHLETPKDLQNLIQASPRLYQVFLLNKTRIISYVARRQFHPAVLSDALTFAKASQFERPLKRETVIKFCEIPPDEMHSWRSSTSSEAESAALCKLARTLRFFIEDYVRNTLPIMEGLGQSLDFEIVPEYRSEKAVLYSELSEREMKRLQRAFCRFEIYRCLFARCSAELNHDIHKCPRRPALSPLEQAARYLGKFSFYESQELYSIRDYLFRRLRGICSEVEDEAVQTLPPERLIFDPEGDFETEEWNSGLYIFTNTCKQTTQDTHLEHLMSLGLPYIRAIIEAPGEQKSALFIRDIRCAVVRHMESEFISKAFECMEQNFEAIDVPIESNPPDVCEWAHRGTPPEWLWLDVHKGFRDWGYVFWDLERLRGSFILEWNPNDVGRVEFDERKAGSGRSVQQRLFEKHGISMEK